jgi:predicted transcriptional regulator YdeE
MEHRIETVTPFDVVGISIRTTNAQAAATIGALWGRFFADGIAAQVPGRVDDRILGVYSDYESDHTGAYDLLVGCAVRGAGTPDGMQRVRVAGGRYAVVTARGEMPAALIRAWLAIWNSGLPRAFTQDFEVLDPARPDLEEIWVALA